jgi:hypothetical protein
METGKSNICIVGYRPRRLQVQVAFKHSLLEFLLLRKKSFYFNLAFKVTG